MATSDDIIDQCCTLLGLGKRPIRIIHAATDTVKFPIFKKKGETVDYEAGWQLAGENFDCDTGKRFIPDGYELLFIECRTKSYEGISFPVGYVKKLDCLVIQDMHSLTMMTQTLELV